MGTCMGLRLGDGLGERHWKTPSLPCLLKLYCKYSNKGETKMATFQNLPMTPATSFFLAMNFPALYVQLGECNCIGIDRQILACPLNLADLAYDIDCLWENFEFQPTNWEEMKTVADLALLTVLLGVG